MVHCGIWTWSIVGFVQHKHSLRSVVNMTFHAACQHANVHILNIAHSQGWVYVAVQFERSDELITHRVILLLCDWRLCLLVWSCWGASLQVFWSWLLIDLNLDEVAADKFAPNLCQILTSPQIPAFRVTLAAVHSGMLIWWGRCQPMIETGQEGVSSCWVNVHEVSNLRIKLAMYEHRFR